MAKFNVFRRIVKEDFDAKDRDLIDKLALPINQFFETVVLAMNKGLELDENVNSQLKDITVSVNGSGIPNNTINFGSTKKGRVKGLLCIKADNLTTPTNYPTSGIILSFFEENSVIKVNHITGLQASESYLLRLLVI